MSAEMIFSLLCEIATVVTAIIAISFNNRQSRLASRDRENAEDTKTATAIAVMQEKLETINSTVGGFGSKLDSLTSDIKLVDKEAYGTRNRVGSLEEWRRRVEKSA